MIALIAVAAALAITPSTRTAAFLPTSPALHLAARVAPAEGYDLSDRHRYFLELSKRKKDQPFLLGYVTFGFYWDGDVVSTISISEKTGMVVDPVACTIFDYPSLKAVQKTMKGDGAQVDSLADLKSQSGCESFKTLRTPTPVRHR